MSVWTKNHLQHESFPVWRTIRVHFAVIDVSVRGGSSGGADNDDNNAKHKDEEKEAGMLMVVVGV